MANSVFLDTNGWLALLNASDELHKETDRIWRDLGAHGFHVVLTDWVVAETGNGLARSQIKNRFVEAVELIDLSPRAEIVYVDQDLLKRALDLYEQHADKAWGIVDCVSFVVMSDKAIPQALTSDKHFEQAGFHCLLSTS